MVSNPASTSGRNQHQDESNLEELLLINASPSYPGNGEYGTAPSYGMGMWTSGPSQHGQLQNQTSHHYSHPSSSSPQAGFDSFGFGNNQHLQSWDPTTSSSLISQDPVEDGQYQRSEQTPMAQSLTNQMPSMMFPFNSQNNNADINTDGIIAENTGKFRHLVNNKMRSEYETIGVPPSFNSAEPSLLTSSFASNTPSIQDGTNPIDINDHNIPSNLNNELHETESSYSSPSQYAYNAFMVSASSLDAPQPQSFTIIPKTPGSNTMTYPTSLSAPRSSSDYHTAHSLSEPTIKSEGKSISNYYQNTKGIEKKKKYRVVRGVSAGGCYTRPPKISAGSDSVFLRVDLVLNGASMEDICLPKWSPAEKEDRRRIIRIERRQNGPKLTADFSLVGSANENPITLPAPPNVDVVEISCLECTVDSNDDCDSSEEEKSNSSGSIKSEVDGETYQYYITSVEVVEIVEFLIGIQLQDPAERRKERGRVRSNLVPFWSKKPISSRMSESNSSPVSGNPTNQDYRVELAKRIMAYEIRKPRGFDKEVRILRWDKLVPALKRALQSYYTEIPQSDLDFT